jgi:hypothetical protein
MGGQRHVPAALPPGKVPVFIAQEAGWAPEPVQTGAEIVAPTWIRSPDRPARSESLYRLSYPGSYLQSNVLQMSINLKSTDVIHFTIHICMLGTT